MGHVPLLGTYILNLKKVSVRGKIQTISGRGTLRVLKQGKLGELEKLKDKGSDHC